MNNIFTIDTEDWFHANYDSIGSLDKNNSIVEKDTNVLLELLDEYSHKATFFILGSVAKDHPVLLRKIADQGHEIACHGMSHQLIYKQTPEEFRDDIRTAKKLIEDICSQKVIGYRAPCWSVTQDSLWALRIIEEEGFLYDCSIFPFKNFLYGIQDAPRFPYVPTRYSAGSKLMEIPATAIRFAGINIPFSGGFYFRVIPGGLIEQFTRQINKAQKPCVFYLHPREIDIEQPRLNLSKKNSFIHYYGIKRSKSKLERLFSKFLFTSIEKEYFTNKGK